MNYGKNDLKHVTQFINDYEALLKKYVIDNLQFTNQFYPDQGHVPPSTLRDSLTYIFKEIHTDDNVAFDNLEAIQDYYKKLTQQFGFDILPSPSFLLDYALGIRKKNISEAIKVLEYAVSIHPLSSDCSYYLGALYELNNNKETALKYYKKTLEIMPGMGQAIRKINALEAAQ